MCGICGLSYSDKRLGDREVLQEMNEAIHYRGPDSDGFYAAEGVGLAIRRLAIIDVKGGDQPISNEDGTVWVVYNGEVYDFQAIREKLDRCRELHNRVKGRDPRIVNVQVRYIESGEHAVFVNRQADLAQRLQRVVLRLRVPPAPCGGRRRCAACLPTSPGTRRGTSPSAGIAC